MSKETELKLIKNEVKAVLKKVGTVQQGVQSLLINSTLYAFKYKGEGADVIASIMNSLTSVKGSFRVESIGYWYSEVAGIECKFSKDVWTCSYVKDKRLSVLGVLFTYDAPHLQACKDLKFWEIAPVVIKELKLATEPDKATSSAEIILARALAGHSMTEEDIKNHLATMFDRVKQLANNGKTKEWLGQYYTQHPEANPTESIADPTELELAELFEAERLEGLESA
jgi:hypothetical protein